MPSIHPHDSSSVDESSSRKRSLYTETSAASPITGPSRGNQIKPDSLSVDNSLLQIEHPQLSGIPADETTDGDVAMDIQKANNFDNSLEFDKTAALTEPPCWNTLPAISRPFINRLCFHLRNDEDCADLANLAQVSTHFRTGVKGFMKRDDNRPGIRTVHLIKSNNGKRMRIELYPSNLPFYDLTILESGKCTRTRDPLNPQLEIALNDPEDPIIEQVSGMLSSYTKDVYISAWAFSSTDFLLCSQLLHNSTIGHLIISTSLLSDDSASVILSLATNTKRLNLSCDDLQLSNPAAFITQLSSDVFSSLLIDHSCSTSTFFGLPHSFWKEFLNKKLENGSFEWIETGNMRGQIKRQFNLPNTTIHFLKWHKKV